MAYGDLERAAYIAGVRAAFDAMTHLLPAGEYQEMHDWIEVDLTEWTEGDPPVSPGDWEMAKP